MRDPQPRIIEVVVDERATRSRVPEPIRQVPGVLLQFKQLPAGDYAVNQRCIFERKTVVDFANSVI